MPRDAKGSKRWLDQKFSHAIVEGQDAQSLKRSVHCEEESWRKAAAVWSADDVTTSYSTKIGTKMESSLQFVN